MTSSSPYEPLEQSVYPPPPPPPGAVFQGIPPISNDARPHPSQWRPTPQQTTVEPRQRQWWIVLLLLALFGALVIGLIFWGMHAGINLNVNQAQDQNQGQSQNQSIMQGGATNTPSVTATTADGTPIGGVGAHPTQTPIHGTPAPTHSPGATPTAVQPTATNGVNPTATPTPGHITTSTGTLLCGVETSITLGNTGGRSYTYTATKTGNVTILTGKNGSVSPGGKATITATALLGSGSVVITANADNSPVSVSASC